MFLPDNINFTESKKYILSIRLIPNGFYFCIHCPLDETIFYQNSISFHPNSDYLKKIEKLIFDYSFFSYNYKQINVISVDDKTTIVPNDIFDKNSEFNFLSFNCHTPKFAINKELPIFDCRIIWGIDKSIHSFLSRTLLNPTFASHLLLIIPIFYKLHNKDTDALFVNFNKEGMMDLISFSGDKLVLAKTFYTNSLLEESYYIQKTWETLQLNTQSAKLIFYGNTNIHSECIETLKKIVIKTEILSMKRRSCTKISEEEVPIEILNQLCEL